jgi:hypothetical protein
MSPALPQAGPHPERKEIARYLLSRDSFMPPDAPTPTHPVPIKKVVFPDGLAPVPAPIDPTPDQEAALPAVDVVVVTWTADEAQALAHVLTPGFSPVQTETHHWYPYKRNFATYEPDIRGGAPARTSGRLGSYLPIKVGNSTVLCMKSELHLNQDGKKIGDGTATLPVKDFFKQIIEEAKPKVFLTIGTAGSVTDEFKLGDVVVTRAARFWLGQEFKNEPWNGKTYRSEWTIPTTQFDQAEKMMAAFVAYLSQPPVGVPSPQYPQQPMVAAPMSQNPRIRLDGRDMAAFHPILTTDWFEYGTTVNRLDRWGAGVEMGDAALGLAIHELAEHERPHWAVVRNMSDPVINGQLPAKDYHLNEQTTWAVGFYTAYGVYTSIVGAIAAWAIIAGNE